ncbi:PAS domain-containing protein [Streptomyces sp. NPDC001100]
MDNQSAVSGAVQGTGAPEDFAVVIDAELNVTAWSAGARALLGHTPDEHPLRGEHRPLSFPESSWRQDGQFLRRAVFSLR